MSAVNKLLDNARESCSLSTDAALADRLQVSRQLVSAWRKGDAPMPDERIAHIARMCHDDPGRWLVRIRAEQTHGEAAKAWTSLLRRLGAAAALVLAVALPCENARADSLNVEGSMHYAKLRRLRRKLTRKLASYRAAWRQAYATTPLLA